MGCYRSLWVVIVRSSYFLAQNLIEVAFAGGCLYPHTELPLAGRVGACVGITF